MHEKRIRDTLVCITAAALDALFEETAPTFR